MSLGSDGTSTETGAPVEEQHPRIDTAAYSAWKGWDDTTRFGALGRGDAAYFARELRNVRRPVHDVLEIGFGSGTFLAYCRTQGWNVTGTELSPEQVDAGRAAGFHVELASALPDLPDSSFDLVAAFDVLEHIPEADSVAFLSTLAAKTRVGGTILLRYPNADTWLGNVFQHGDPTHVSAIGYHKLQYLAERSGLDLVTYRSPARRGFRTSFIHGVHAATAGTIVKTVAALQKALYFPGVPLVLSSSNVVCVLSPRTAPSSR